MSTDSTDSSKARRITKRRLAVVLAATFFIIIIYAAFFASVPSITVPFRETHVTNYWQGKEPPVSLQILILFTAEGSLSVNNRVHVHAILSNANVSNVLQYYGWLAFTGGYNVSTVGKQDQAPNLAFLPITASQSSSGQYEADGDVIWLKEGSTWPVLVPATGGQIEIHAPDVEVGTPAAIIASVSDTLSRDMSLREERLTLVLVAFSVLMLQPILEALFVKESVPQQEVQAKPQGLWHQHKLWRKKRSQETQTT